MARDGTTLLRFYPDNFGFADVWNRGARRSADRPAQVDRKRHGEVGQTSSVSWTRWNFACSALNSRFTALKLRETPAPTYHPLPRIECNMCARRSPSAPKLQGVGKPSSDGWWYLPPIAPRWRGRRHFFFEQQTRQLRRQAAGRSSRSAPPSHPAQASRWRASSLFDRTLTRCATARSVAAVRRLRPRAALSFRERLSERVGEIVCGRALRRAAVQPQHAARRT